MNAKEINRLMKMAETGTATRVSIPDMLEFRRDQYALTCAEFAKILGMHASHYSEIKNGKRGLPLKAMRRAVAIGVPADVLLQTRVLKI